jgi:hypothetical protein
MTRKERLEAERIHTQLDGLCELVTKARSCSVVM